MDNKETEFDMIFKVLIIGDSGVGKSNLLLRFIKNEYSEHLKSTVGAEFSSKLMTVDQVVVKVQIWDTAGQERYRSMTDIYYKGAKGVLIIFDLTNIESFNNINRWVDEFKMKSDSNSIMIMVGNKNDLIEKRVVSRETAEIKAKQLSMAYFETSAKDNVNVELAFTVLVEKIVNKYQVILTDGDPDNLEDGLKLDQDENDENEDSNSVDSKGKKKKKSSIKNCCK